MSDIYKQVCLSMFLMRVYLIFNYDYVINRINKKSS